MKPLEEEQALAPTPRLYSHNKSHLNGGWLSKRISHDTFLRKAPALYYGSLAAEEILINCIPSSTIYICKSMKEKSLNIPDLTGGIKEKEKSGTNICSESQVPPGKPAQWQAIG